MIHTIHKGFIGEIAVIKDLVTNYTNYNVFKPIIDEKGVDLIVERRKKSFLSASKDDYGDENKNIY